VKRGFLKEVLKSTIWEIYMFRHYVGHPIRGRGTVLRKNNLSEAIHNGFGAVLHQWNEDRGSGNKKHTNNNDLPHCELK